MRIDNDGEGGIIALMTLLGVKKRHRPGARRRRPLRRGADLRRRRDHAGDLGALGARRHGAGRAVAADATCCRAAVAILLALFAIQPQGTARIGQAFGPIMLVWFVVMAALGVYGVAQHPSVLVAINPLYGLEFLVSGGMTGFLVLGGVFLCVTGAEALYADMGHFGPTPIRLAWNGVVFPSLVLNYAGQAALVLDGAPTTATSSIACAPARCSRP